MKSIFAVLFMALTVSCYYIDRDSHSIESRSIESRSIESRSIESRDIATPGVTEDDLRNLISRSHNIGSHRSPTHKFTRYASHMLQSEYTFRGYNYIIARGTITVVNGCDRSTMDAIKTKKIVQITYPYNDVDFKVAIFPSPCKLSVVFKGGKGEACQSCDDSFVEALKDMSPPRLPLSCEKVYTEQGDEHSGDYRQVYTVTCKGLPLDYNDVNAVIGGSHKIHDKAIEVQEFPKYAGNMLQSHYGPYGYNYLIYHSLIEIYTANGVRCDFKEGEDKSIVKTRYAYGGINWGVWLIPGPCEVTYANPNRIQSFWKFPEPTSGWGDKVPTPKTRACRSWTDWKGWDVLSCLDDSNIPVVDPKGLPS